MQNNNSATQLKNFSRQIIASSLARQYSVSFERRTKNCTHEPNSSPTVVLCLLNRDTARACISLCSNAPPSLECYEEGKCHGFGNSLPSAPFQKVRFGQQRFQKIVEDYHHRRQVEKDADATEENLIEDLQELLKRKDKFWPDPELKRRAPKWGEHLSAINVNIPDAGYGSRTHTIVLIDAEDKMHFFEETMTGTDPEGEWVQTHIEKRFFKND